LENKTYTRILAVTSGKGGVGKTNISAGVAMALAREGHRVCLFDADLGLANINILLGLNPEYNLEDLISGQKTLDEILVRNFHGIDIIPGSSGVESIANLNEPELIRLIAGLGSLKEYDFLIFDTSAGISAPVIAFCMAASEVLIVITPEPTSLTDAYALLKVLLANGFNGKARIVVNQCRDVNQAKKIFHKFNEAVLSHLKATTNLTGVVVSDPNITASVKEQKAFLDLYPDTKATKCVVHLAKTLLSNVPEGDFSHDLAPFWEQCFKLIKSPLSIKGVRKKSQDQDSEKKDDLIIKAQEEKQDEPSSSKDDEKTKESSLNIADVDALYQDTIKDVHPPSDKSGNGEMPGLIKELIQSVKSVSDELRNIRESMGKVQPQSGGMKTAASVEAVDLVRNSNMFVLDFEAFQKKHHG
jgi:flagellar biosynthesis protein FlhG